VESLCPLLQRVKQQPRLVKKGLWRHDKRIVIMTNYCQEGLRGPVIWSD
jgi:hypothetical protein